MRALRSCRLQQAPSAELWSFLIVSGECSTASHQLSHTPSRHHLKLKQSAPVILLSRWAHTSSILGDGCSHFDPAACNKHLPLSFGAAHRLRRVPDCHPSAQPRPITSPPQTEAECTSNSPLAMRWPINILIGDGCVHFDPAACNEHLPLSSGASSQSQAST